MPLTSGRVSLSGLDLTATGIAARRAAVLPISAPTPRGEGLCVSASITENAIAGHHRRKEFQNGGFLKPRAIARHVETLLDSYSVRRASASLPIGSLSGGNQQRVAIAANWTASRPA